MLVNLTPEKPHLKAASIQTLDSSMDWIASFMDVNSYRGTSPKQSDFIERDRNFESKITHPGLIHYAHLCWAKEHGLSLRPDMIYNALISEIAFDILDSPNDYAYLFTADTTKKIDIFTIGKLFDYDQIISMIQNRILEPDFASAICDVKFESDVPNAHIARLMAFANMGTPFFNLFGTLCGIPHVEILGSFDDWFNLYNTICILKRFGPSEQSSKYKIKSHTDSMTKSINIVANIIYYCFDTKLESMTQMYNSKVEFFSDIFHYDKNVICGSGHDTMVVSGWLRFFYLDSDEGKDLDHYHCHTNYVCMHDLITNKRYCQVVSLAFSDMDIENNILRPGYGIITYEIMNRKIYNKLAMVSKGKDLFGNLGNAEYKMTKNELQEVIEKGTICPGKKECTLCKNAFPDDGHYYSNDGIDICEECAYGFTVIKLADDTSNECLLCKNILDSVNCPKNKALKLYDKYICSNCTKHKWFKYFKDHGDFIGKCDWCNKNISNNIYTSYDGINVCQQCTNLVKESLEKRESIIFPCLGPTNRTSDKRSWFVPAGKTPSQLTVCEECFEDNIKDTADAPIFTEYNNVANCCCDYQLWCNEKDQQ